MSATSEDSSRKSQNVSENGTPVQQLLKNLAAEYPHISPNIILHVISQGGCSLQHCQAILERMNARSAENPLFHADNIQRFPPALGKGSYVLRRGGTPTSGSPTRKLSEDSGRQQTPVLPSASASDLSAARPSMLTVKLPSAAMRPTLPSVKVSSPSGSLVVSSSPGTSASSLPPHQPLTIDTLRYPLDSTVFNTPVTPSPHGSFGVTISIAPSPSPRFPSARQTASTSATHPEGLTGYVRDQKQRKEQFGREVDRLRKRLEELRSDVEKMDTSWRNRQRKRSLSNAVSAEQVDCLHQETRVLTADVDSLLKCVNSETPPEAELCEEDADRWSCNACTFLNHPALHRCEICDMPRVLDVDEGWVIVLPSNDFRPPPLQ